MGIRKNRSAVDAVTLLIYEIQSRQKKGEKAAALFIDVKGAFDHVFKKKLVERITDLRFDEDLIDQTQSFIINRKIEFIIDGYINLEVIVNIDIP